MASSMRLRWACLTCAAVVASAAGCGTTKWSDSPRTATEQLLISDAVDRAVSEIDFSALSDRSVFLDTKFIEKTLDKDYVISTLRQHMLASGCIIQDEAEKADYVVEVRSGSLGTNRNDVLLGVPATNLPSVGLLPVGTASIPEIAIAKNTTQQAVCKIAVFAYDRESGRPVWQSGNRKIASRAKDSWLLGTGPFQRGSIYEGTAFAGERIRVPLLSRWKKPPTPASTSVASERVFEHRGENALDDSRDVQNAGYQATLPAKTGEPGRMPPVGAGQEPGRIPPGDAGVAP
ncbi:MAG: hypothetical protein DWQ37_10340 [Planctomycetota bacterium]|nr:MAG: hypothetical protein DWQ37_10340 [Planctomycetota bacterium]